MRDYSDAPAWATEAFFTKPYEGAKTWYYGNDVQFISREHIKQGFSPSSHDHSTLENISGKMWWREQLYLIKENE